MNNVIAQAGPILLSTKLIAVIWKKASGPQKTKYDSPNVKAKNTNVSLIGLDLICWFLVILVSLLQRTSE